MPTDPRRAAELTRIARFGSEEERSRISSDLELDIEGQLAIATAPEPHVAAGILHNYSIGPAIIGALVAKHPELAEDAAGHPNAPVEMKDALPVWQHSDLSIDRYLSARSATPDQAEAVKARRGDTALLGAVWEECSREAV